ncbi:MAG: DNA repair protein RadA [Dehalococcoidia bacterium SG8_51_3]|nr:MAG: DNA repair protein RadA [Dehalococcoidia bacterium SG8_51_3]
MKSSSQGKSRFKAVFVCQQCGKESPKWLGHCPDCQAWNSFVETKVASSRIHSRPHAGGNKPQELSQVGGGEFPRLRLGFTEMNRVLGGGLVPGSLVLVGGEPGIGKSTLLLQISAMMAEDDEIVAYVSGEESVSQVKLRSERLGIAGKRIFFLSEPDLAAVLECLESLAPGLAVVDSIQTMYLDDIGGMPGSVSQVRECTWRLERWAKQKNVPLLITGHVTKEGAIAGPGTLEHIVDVVLYFEGERFSSYRVLRSEKNRFGSTNEVGIFEMSDRGLLEVHNPSEVFLSAYKDQTMGSVAVPTLEGNRPLLVEIQALTTPNSFSPPRRIANGVDFNRLLLITAVLIERAGLKLFNQDIIVNVTGGLRVHEPAVDLGIALAIASSFRDARPVSGLVAFGEVGLNGELRGVSQVERRVAEAIRLGFKSCLMPRLKAKPAFDSGDIELTQAGSIAEALRMGLTGGVGRGISRDEHTEQE